MHPFVLTQTLQGRQCFEVQLNSGGGQPISAWVGILAATSKNSADCAVHPDSMAVYFGANGESNLSLEGKVFNLPKFQISNGSLLSVSIDTVRQEIEWKQLLPIRQTILR